DIVAAAKPASVMRPAPRYFVSGGAFVGSRGMTFTKNPPDATSPTPDYPAAGLYGLSLAAAGDPMPDNKLDHPPAGLGIALSLQHSIGAYMSAMDPDEGTYGDYTIDHTAYEGGIHYRYPVDFVSLDGEVNYGRYSYTIADLPGSLLIPDVDYSYLGFGGHIDVAVTDRTRVGFGAKYMYLLSAGDVSDQGWYGAGTASGIDLNADFTI